PACLAIILAHHGLRVPVNEIRERCGVGRDGLSGTGLKIAADLYGVEIRAWRVTAAEAAGLPVPSMVFVDARHYVVLEGVRRGWVYLNDPAVGRVRLSKATSPAGSAASRW